MASLKRERVLDVLSGPLILPSQALGCVARLVAGDRSQREVAGLLGVSQPVVQRAMKGERDEIAVQILSHFQGDLEIKGPLYLVAPRDLGIELEQLAALQLDRWIVQQIRCDD